MPLRKEDLKFEPLSPRMRTGDATGEKHGRLTVLGYAGEYHWWCECDCGNIHKARIGAIRTGQILSCGCLQRESQRRNGQLRKIHGYSGHYLIRTWNGIKHRCLNPKAINYERYGGRGIKIYPLWLDNDPVAFCDWIDQNLGPRPKGHTLDRIDNDGHYEPGNLRWATISEQAKNQRRGP